MIEIRSAAEIEKIREAGVITHEVLKALSNNAKVGQNTEALDRIAEDLIRSRKAKPAFLGYMDYPKSICSSVNNSVVHEIPSPKRILQDGDIISFDVGVEVEGYFADSALTVGVGQISDQAERLLKVTKESLAIGIEKAVEGNRVSDISHAIQSYVEENKFSVVRYYVGHGIGRKIHEAPEIPNFGEPNRGPRLLEGMILAIEPMVNAGGYDIRILDDGWTAVTKDGSLSSHFEHTVLVKKGKAEILT